MKMDGFLEFIGSHLAMLLDVAWIGVIIAMWVGGPPTFTRVLTLTVIGVYSSIRVVASFALGEANKPQQPT